MTTALVLLRHDLRLEDNPALHAACAAHESVLPVFVHAPEEDGAWQAGAASRWWLHHSLERLDAAFAQQGGALFLARGKTLEVVRKLIQRCGADAVYWNRRYEPAAIAADSALKAALRKDGTTVASKRGNLCCEPWKIATQRGDPYRVFTPFWRTWRARPQPDAPLPAARAQHWLTAKNGLPLAALELLPSIPWDAGLCEAWQPGEAGAHAMLESFLDGVLLHYETVRDLPTQHGTSRLSPHLHFGEITPRQIAYALRSHERAGRQADVEPYLRQIAWREFAQHLLYHFPYTPTENFHSSFDAFPWAPDAPDAIRLWQRGMTGVPLVDAGMRELWQTGWMHNRVRMVAASWLTKNLRQHWLHGARWFWDTLVDADLANNTLGWQWVAGCGADAAPYFRVFNPYTQAKKFDPDAVYLKRWLPELARLPTPILHEPWRDAGAVAGCGYPSAMVDAAASRKAALAAWERMDIA